jgi:hypothetical protein
VSGAAFTTEVGDEIGGFFRNLAIGTSGSTDEIASRIGVQDFGFQGDGFWFQGAGISVVGNVSAGNQGNAFAFYNHGLIEGGVQGRFLSANLLDPSIANGASTISVSHVPILNFRNNQGYASAIGITLRYHLENPLHSQYSVFSDSQFWNNGMGMALHYSQDTILRNLSFVQTSEGIQPNLVTGNITFDHLTVTGYGRGIVLPRWGNNVIDGGTLSNTYDIVIRNAIAGPRYVEIKNLAANPVIIMTPELDAPLHSGNTAEMFFVSDVVILNYGQFVNRRLYSEMQLSDFVPFPSARPDLEIDSGYINRSNLYLMANYQKAIGGASVLPATYQVVPNIIDGLVSLF